MKIKCVKLSVDNQDKSVTNGQMKGYIELNKIYITYGISYHDDITYAMIFKDNHIIKVPIELFEIVDNNLPTNLQFKICEDGEVTMYPELFYNEWFFDKFSDFEPEERKLFEDLRLKMDY